MTSFVTLRPHLGLITCCLLVSFYHDLIWITLYSFIFLPWLDMDYFIFFIISSMTWHEALCSHFIPPFMTWYDLFISYLWLDMAYIVYPSSILSWLNMNCLVSIFLFHDLIWIDVTFTFFHDLIRINTVCIFFPWLDMGHLVGI